MKLLLIIGFVALMTDPCHVSPKTLSFAEVNDRCRSDHPTKYTKLRGKLLDRGDVKCGDMPRGVHCELIFGEDGVGANFVRVLVKSGKEVDGSTRRNFISFKPPADWDGIKPVNVPFDSITIFDKDGGKVVHHNEEIEIAGTLNWDEQTQQCTQRNIQFIERVK